MIWDGFGKSDVSPGITPNHTADRATGNAKVTGNTPAGHRLRQFANLVNIGSRQFRQLSPLGIDGPCHRFHVVGIDTRRVAAHVIQLQPFGDRSVLPLVEDDVRGTQRAAVSQSAISVGGLRSLEYPASGHRIDDIDRLESVVVPVDETDGLPFGVTQLRMVPSGDRRGLSAAAHAETRRIRSRVGILRAWHRDLLRGSGCHHGRGVSAPPAVLRGVILP